MILLKYGTQKLSSSIYVCVLERVRHPLLVLSLYNSPIYFEFNDEYARNFALSLSHPTNWISNEFHWLCTNLLLPFILLFSWNSFISKNNNNNSISIISNIANTRWKNLWKTIIHKCLIAARNFPINSTILSKGRGWVVSNLANILLLVLHVLDKMGRKRKSCIRNDVHWYKWYQAILMVQKKSSTSMLIQLRSIFFFFPSFDYCYCSSCYCSFFCLF